MVLVFTGEFRVALPWELLYTYDLVVIAETEDDLIKRLSEWKGNVDNRGMKVNVNKTKFMISGEQHENVEAVRWPYGVCGRDDGNNSIQCTSCQKWNIWVKKCMEYEVGGARPRGRQKITWREIVEKDCHACKLNREDAMDHNRWKKQIRDD